MLIAHLLMLIALAQQSESNATQTINERLRKPLVEGCNRSVAGSDEIVVCGRSRDDPEYYRITDPNAPFDPEGQRESVARERSRWVEDGDTGIQSCSPVGPGAGPVACLRNGANSANSEVAISEWHCHVEADP